MSRLIHIRPGRVVAAAVAVFAFWTAPAAADTVVTLTFDDGYTNQLAAQDILADHDMHGTFYVITGRVGQSTPANSYMTWQEIDSVYDDGNEIGGHTQNHLHLPTLPEDQQRSEICDARQALLAKGYPQVSFAYPFGDHDPTSERLVGECGYLSGRGVAGLQRDPGEPDAETIPPQDQWLVRTRGSVDVDDTLPEIQDWIMDAEAVDDGNGTDDALMNLVFHHVCDPGTDPSCPSSRITPSDFDALLDWLEVREPSGTHVETMAKVMDPNPPVTQISCNGAACQSGLYDNPVSVALSSSDAGLPGVDGNSGVKEIRYTTDGSNPNTSSPLYTGPITLSASTTIRFRAWDNAGNAEATNSQTIEITPPPSPPGGGTPGSSGGTLGAFTSFKSLPNGTAKLTVEVSGPGELEAIDASFAGASAAAKRTAMIKPTSKAVAQAGEVTLKIVPSKAGKRILRRKGKLSVLVRVTFSPVTGSPMSETVRVKLKLKD